ncbi:SRPBCC family protein [Kribbella sp. NPDC051620]|uniref:SRPBCC family protein n=1 Tax=Kribbella sp. NPDC051620 TaxID=3364120 RepID=UPI0037B529A9
MPDPTALFGPTERTVTRSGERRTVRLQRPYAATPTELWSACTEPERLTRWIGRLAGDRVIGGEVRLRMTADETVVLRIEACEEPRRLQATWSTPGEPDSRIELTLSGQGETTMLTLEHSLLSDEQAAAGKGLGWEDFLNRLHELLAGRDPAAVSWDEALRHLEPIWSALVYTAS